MAQQGVTVLNAALLALSVALLSACSAGGTTGPSEGDVASAPNASAPGSAPAMTATTAPMHNVLVFGDSLSAAYNLAAEQGWVALLDARMQAEAPGFRMVNASISGETSAGGAARIDAALAQHRPAVVVLALGANDGLRGLPLEETRANLVAMTRAAKASGAHVLVVGIRLPPNYGPDYTDAFFAMFGDIARTEGTAHLPFLLEPIALEDSAFQPDRLHPTAEVQPRLAEHVWETLAPLLQSSSGQSAASSVSR